MMAQELDRFTARVAEHFQSALGSSLVEVYKLGSLAHGGYSEIYSDIDIGLLLSCAEPPPAIAAPIARRKDAASGIRQETFNFLG